MIGVKPSVLDMVWLVLAISRARRRRLCRFRGGLSFDTGSGVKLEEWIVGLSGGPPRLDAIFLQVAMRSASSEWEYSKNPDLSRRCSIDHHILLVQIVS